MAAEETPVRSVQLGYAPAAGFAIQTPLANEIGSLAAEAAGDSNDLKSLDFIFPIATIGANAVVELEPLLFGMDGNLGDLLATPAPLPAALPARA